MLTVDEAIRLISEEIPKSSRAPLYHFTHGFYLYSILSNDRLGGRVEEETSMPTPSYHEIKSISLTRRNKFWHHGNVRLTLDQVKLRSNYKVRPYVDFMVAPKGKGHDALMKDEPGYKRRWEAEEWVKAPVRPLSRYLIAIDFHKDEIRDMLKRADRLISVIDYQKRQIELVKKGLFLPDPGGSLYKGDNTPIPIPDTPRSKKRWSVKGVKEEIKYYVDNEIGPANYVAAHPKLSSEAKSKLRKKYPIKVKI